MPVYTDRGSGTPVTTGTTWANLANAVDGTPPANPATYATMTNATSGAVATIEISGFDFNTAIPADATGLTNISVTVRHLQNNTGRFASVAFTVWDGATQIGGSTAGTLATTAHDNSGTYTPTLAQLKSATFKVRVTITGAASTQSRVFSIDHVNVAATYTLPVKSGSATTGHVWAVSASGTAPVVVPPNQGTAAVAWAMSFVGGVGTTPAVASGVYGAQNQQQDWDIPKPPNMVAGDMLVFLSGTEDTTVEPVWTFTNSTGWAKAAAFPVHDPFNQHMWILCYWKVASAADVALANFTLQLNQNKYCYPHITRLTDHGGTAPVLLTSWLRNDGGVPRILGGTTTQDGLMLIGYGTSYESGPMQGVTTAEWTALPGTPQQGNVGFYRSQTVPGAFPDKGFDDIALDTAGASCVISLRGLPSGDGGAIGKMTPKGAATTSWAVATSAVGAKPSEGVLSGPRILELGSVERLTEDGVTRNLELTVQAGSAAVSWSATPTASGKKTQQATASTTWTEAVAAAGKRIARSTVTTTYVEALSAAGKRTPKGAITTGHTWVPAAVGKETPKATAVTTWTEALTAAGKKTPKGSITTTWTAAVTSVTVITETFAGAAAPLTTGNWGRLHPTDYQSLSTDGAGAIAASSFGANTHLTPLSAAHFCEIDFVAESSLVLGLFTRLPSVGSYATCYEVDVYELSGASNNNVFGYRNGLTWRYVGYNFTEGSPYTFRLEAHGGHTRTLINGVVVMARVDASPVVGSYVGVYKETGGDPVSITEFRAGNVAGAVGSRLSKGSVTTTWAETVSAIGKRTPKAAATAAHDWAPTATGVTPEVGMNQGTAAVAWTAAVTAVGWRESRGDATTAYSWTLSATGTKPLRGSASTSWTEAPAAAGKRAPKATVTTTVVYATTAAGKRAPKATVTTTWTEAVTAAGKRVPKATATTSYTETLTAAGKRTPKAAATTAHLWSLAATGRKPLRGSAIVAHNWLVTAVGASRPSQGLGTASVSWSEFTTAAGRRAPKSTVITTVTFTSSAIGRRVPKATATTSYVEAVTVQSKRIPKSTVIVATTWAVSVAGKRQQKGVATVAFLWQPAVVSKRVPKGAADALHIWISDADGFYEPKGAGDTDYWFSQVAIGVKPGQIEAIWNGQEVTEMQYGDKAVIDWLLVPS